MLGGSSFLDTIATDFDCRFTLCSFIGEITYLYDISCLPQAQEHHIPFTSFIGALWEAGPPTVTLCP